MWRHINNYPVRNVRNVSVSSHRSLPLHSSLWTCGLWWTHSADSSSWQTLCRLRLLTRWTETKQRTCTGFRIRWNKLHATLLFAFSQIPMKFDDIMGRLDICVFIQCIQYPYLRYRWWNCANISYGKISSHHCNILKASMLVFNYSTLIMQATVLLILHRTKYKNRER